MKKLQYRSGLAGMESRLSKFSFFTRKDLPGYADGLIFMALSKIQRHPDRQLCPNLYHWYVLMHQFAESTVSRWISDYIFFDPEDSAIHDFIRILYAPSLEESSTPPEEQIEDNYILEIISKDNVEQALQNLRRELVGFKVNIIESKHLGELRVECRLTEQRLNELKGLLDRKIEYKYVHSKRRGKTMNPFKETVMMGV